MLNKSYTLSLDYTEALKLIEDAQSIAISGHTNPDGDALGSGLALLHGIKSLYPNKELQLLLADDAEFPPVYSFLEGSDLYIPASSYKKKPDLFISVDTPKPDRLHNSQEVFNRACKRLALDHHPDMYDFADCNLKYAEHAAVACLVAELFEAAGLKADKPFAQAIYTGIITDTGRFQYQNTNSAALEIAAAMVLAGADPAQVALEVYQSSSFGYLKLEALVAERLCVDCDGRFAYSYVRHKDFKDLGVRKDESDGLIDIVRRLKGSEICLLLREETQRGIVRGNLRSKSSDYDVSSIAHQFNGGGHKAAAGFSFEGNLEEALCSVIPYIHKLLESKDRG